MSKLEDLTRGLTNEVAALHLKFEAGKIDWGQLDRRATVLEAKYLEKVKALLATGQDNHGG